MPNHFFNSVESIVKIHPNFQFIASKNTISHKGIKYVYVGHVTPVTLGLFKILGNTIKLVLLAARILLLISRTHYQELFKRTWSETYGIKTKRIEVFILESETINKRVVDDFLWRTKNENPSKSEASNTKTNKAKKRDHQTATPKTKSGQFESPKVDKKFHGAPTENVDSSSHNNNSTRPFPNKLTSQEIEFFKGYGGKTEECGIAEEAFYYFYGCNDSENPSKHLNDSGWGCAWRSLQTIVSCMPFKNEPMKDIFSKYRYPQQILDAYKRMYPNKVLTDEEEEAILDSAPSNHGNWAEPFIGSLYLHDKGIKSSLLLYNRAPGNMHAPRFVFPETISSFNQFGKTLVDHFKTQKCPIMLDDGLFAFAMVGAKETNNHFHFWVADPHTTRGGNHGLFIVSVNKTTGQQEHHNCSKNRNEFASAPLSIKFDNKAWMVLLPKIKAAS